MTQIDKTKDMNNTGLEPRLKKTAKKVEKLINIFDKNHLSKVDL